MDTTNGRNFTVTVARGRLLAIIALVIAVWAPDSRGQPEMPDDAELCMTLLAQGVNPIDPQLTPFWEVVHNQEELFSQIFNCE